MFGKKSALKCLLKQRVIITPAPATGMPMFSGVVIDILLGSDGTELVLADMKHLESGQPIAGVCYMNRRDIAFMQRTYPSAA